LGSQEVSAGVSEQVVNAKLAEILSRDFGLDCRAERVKDRRRPDIRCYYRGSMIVIESSYSRGDAERDARGRIEGEQRMADIAMALWIKERFRDAPEPQLYETIRKASYDVRVFASTDIGGTLLKYLERSTGRRAEPATGWFENLNLPMVKAVIDHSIDFMVNEEDVAEIMKNIETVFNNFIEVLKNLDRRGSIRRSIYDILYKLYGLTIAEAHDPDIAFGHTALSILLSVVFYEHIRSAHPELESLGVYTNAYGPIEGLRKALEELLRIDYRPALELAIEVLSFLPADVAVAWRVKDLIDLARKIASEGALLRRDFTGRLYRRITGNIAVRKGFATFYTEVPAAYLLAYLATSTLLGLDERPLTRLNPKEAYRVVERIRSTKVGDFACGSGTLLIASYSTLMHIATLLKHYYNLEDIDLEDLGRELVESGIYGIDALRYASQVTAINLALMAPSTIAKENVYTVYLGYIAEKRQAWLGSLELLRDSGRVGGLLAYIEGGLRGVAEKVSIHGAEGTFSIPTQFDLIIMNPPFTRATGRSEKFGESRGLFGFIVDEGVKKKFLDAYNSVRKEVMRSLRDLALSIAHTLPDLPRQIVQGLIPGADQYLSISQAGEGLLFLYLAYRYVRDGGVIAFVLPRNLLAGVSWFLARVLLASKFHVKYVVVSSDSGKGYNFSEGTSLSETLIVARRVDRHSDDEETVFVNILSKPSTALESMMFAEEVVRRSSTRYSGIVEVGGSRATILRVDRRHLLNHLDNWNRFTALTDIELLRSTMCLYDAGEVVL